MKIQEFRIGNYVTLKGYAYDEIDTHNEITGITDEHPFVDTIVFDYLDYDEIEPIPLTEEWLLKFGFEFNVLTNRYELDDWRFDITKPANYDGLLLCEGSTAITDRIKYVHQLQNLYFALTGEEFVLLKSN